MIKQQRVQIFIDAGNFHHLALKKLRIKELDFSFNEFAAFLAQDRTITSKGKRFYIGVIKEDIGDPKNKEYLERQEKLFTSLKSEDWQAKTSDLKLKTENIIINSRMGDYQNLLDKGFKNIQYSYLQEKGIDVKMATDMIAGAIDDQYDTAILVSSDSDLIPALDWIRKRAKKKVEYVGFAIKDQTRGRQNSRPSQALMEATDSQKILTKSDLEKFIRKTATATLPIKINKVKNSEPENLSRTLVSNHNRNKNERKNRQPRRRQPSYRENQDKFLRF